MDTLKDLYQVVYGPSFLQRQMAQLLNHTFVPVCPIVTHHLARYWTLSISALSVTNQGHKAATANSTCGRTYCLCSVTIVFNCPYQRDSYQIDVFSYRCDSYQQNFLWSILKKMYIYESQTTRFLKTRKWVRTLCRHYLVLILLSIICKYIAIITNFVVLICNNIVITTNFVVNICYYVGLVHAYERSKKEK